jgi:hypothetical protein
LCWFRNRLKQPAGPAVSSCVHDFARKSCVFSELVSACFLDKQQKVKLSVAFTLFEGSSSTDLSTKSVD